MLPTGHVFIATSLDGFIAREDGSVDWLLKRDAADEDHGYDAFIARIDALVMGRKTFEMARAFDPWPYDLPVFVLSTKLTVQDIPRALRDTVKILNLSPREVMEELGKSGFERIYIDGGIVIQSFLARGLIKDLIITRVPVLLGRGRPLFGPLPGDIDFDLIHKGTRQFASGLVQSRYRVVR